MSETKNPFFSFRVIILIVVALIVVTIIAASGIVYIPGFSEVLGTNKPRDLGVKAGSGTIQRTPCKGECKTQPARLQTFT